MALQRFAFRAMAAANEIQVDGDDPGRAHAAAGEAIAEVLRIEAKYSRYRPDSVLSRINVGAGGAPVAVDPETEALLDYAGACWHESAGLFDATSGVLRRAWDFGARRVPGEAELAPLLALVGWQRVERSPGRVRLPLAGMELDFGGLGKEYAVDRAVAVLRDAGVASALVNLAGDLAILGPRPGGQPWRVGLRHPRREGELAATFAVTSGAIATSGDYERFVEVDGVRHCHVLDPRTGRSAQGFQSVSVHAPACLVAGSATTVAMLKGESEGLAWLEALGLPFHAILADGRVTGRDPG
ncbi:MAG TPA: FAD:protein FMN transferase [Usitatibacteraceae bacterium]|jgi:thiamine biosynthesis lipoprotein|nr:FAD:protein FMN transferase [Usitatibacteraceae bacterium]HQY45404.1 FAD:protein FMN transferase [Usitatibacteraceae bacterium]HRA23089.1 FAD:protein FMN transferase [Usitatibacteraceae bacterium]